MRGFEPVLPVLFSGHAVSIQIHIPCQGILCQGTTLVVP